MQEKETNSYFKNKCLRSGEQAKYDKEHFQTTLPKRREYVMQQFKINENIILTTEEKRR